MDQERFDRVARALGSAQSRRDAVRTALAGVSAGLAATFGINALDADAKNQGNGKNKNAGDKSSGKKKKKGKSNGSSRTVSCVEYGDPCHSAQDCCDKADHNVVCQNPAGGDPHGDKTCNCPGLNDGGHKPDFNTDPNNCGKCGTKCGTGQVCRSGKCVASCKPESPETTCKGNKCGEVKNNCGDDVDCGNCQNGYACNNQSHTCTCPSPRVTCNGKCCPTGQKCEGNKCVTPCKPENPSVTCAGGKCGTVKNNCGQDVNCGNCKNGFTCTDHKCTCPSRTICQGVCCAAGQKCEGNKCVTPCVPETPKQTCDKAGSVCGTQKNNCGQTVNCGECKNGFDCKDNKTCVCPSPRVSCGAVCCPSGQKCEGGKCVTPCVPDSPAETCRKAGSTCGTVKNNCGQNVDCGICKDGKVCQDNKTCVCPSPRVTCGAVCCPEGQKCEGGKCVTPCVPETPKQTCDKAGSVCGTVKNNCGQDVNCGVCKNGFDCKDNKTCVCPAPRKICEGVCCESSGAICKDGNGACCVPKTREQVCTEGVCGKVSDGCGGTIDCGTEVCGPNNTCQNNQCVCPGGNPVCNEVCCDKNQVCNATGGACCTPTTTTCPANTCGTIDDGCGHPVECPKCPAGSTCQGNTCVVVGCASVGQACSGIKACCGNLECKGGICGRVDPACAPRGKSCADSPCCNSNDTCGTGNICKQVPPTPDPKCAKNGERPRNGAKCCGRLHENHGRCRTNRWERCNKADHRQPNCGCDRETRCKNDHRGGSSCQGR